MWHDDGNCCELVWLFSASAWSLSFYLFLYLSLTISFDCMQSRIFWLYSAAILVTQLTTPYIRIAPAAGDNQLTGQIFGTFSDQLSSSVNILVLPVPCYLKTPPPPPKKKVWFLLVPCYCHRFSDLFKDSTVHLYLLIITAHERPVWLLFDVSALGSFGKS